MPSLTLRPRTSSGPPSSASDPLSRALAPPPNATPEELAEHSRAAAQARETSRRIDDMLAEDRKALERKKRATKVLLLGQAESGKSTVLKNLKLAFCPTQFKNEHAAWKTVIQLNLIRSIKRILAVVQTELDSYTGSSASTTRRTSLRGASSPSSPPPRRLTDAHRLLRMRLSPLLAIEAALTRRLHATFPDAADWTPADTATATPAYRFPPDSSTPAGSAPSSPVTGPAPGVDVWDLDVPVVRRRGSAHELCVRAGVEWRAILLRATGAGAGPASPDSRRPQGGGRSDDPTGALAACREDVCALWRDPAVRAVLAERNMHPERESGFFLDDADRIARFDYAPTVEDMLRARLMTIGVEEHRLELEANPDAREEWYVYDVGGSRTQRHQWVSYLDDATAIIFLAPLTFDRFLEEDPNVNRLEDSLGLWKVVCRSPLLARAALVLLLNKRDVLARTLADGVPVRRYIARYDGPNELAPVTKYFRKKFVEVHTKYTPNRTRDLFVYETCCTQQKETEAILWGVRTSILHENLREVNLLP